MHCRFNFLRLKTHLFLLAAFLCLLSCLQARAAEPVDHAKGTTFAKIKPFLQKHCFSCHGEKVQKGDLRYDTLGDDLSDEETLLIWQDILDQINLGQMPPKKQPRPDVSEIAPVVEVMTAHLKQAYTKLRSSRGHAVIRRLNRHELRNTLRDLLYLKGAAYRPDVENSRLNDNNGNGSIERTGNDPLRFFPVDEDEEGFVNIGNTLVMSDFLLNLMLGAAEETLDDATHLEPKPDTSARTFAGHIIKEKSYGQQPIEGVSREINKDYDLMVQGYERFGRLSPTGIRSGVGTAARYRITVEASAHNQTHPWGEIIKTDQSEPMQLCLNIADAKRGGIAGLTSTSVALWPLPGDGKKRTFSHEVWMGKTWTTWLGWANGPFTKSLRGDILMEKFVPKSFVPRPDKKTDAEAHKTWPIEMARALIKAGYKGPHIRVYSIKIEPLIDTWPPKSHAMLYGAGIGNEAQVRQLMTTFAERAFRRMVTPAEIEPYVKLVVNQLEPQGPTATPTSKQKPDVVTALPSTNATNVGGRVEALSYKVYRGKWSKLPDFSKLKPSDVGVLKTGWINIKPAESTRDFAMVFEGKIEAQHEGDYYFESASDDGSRILINGKPVVTNDGLHGADTIKRGKIKLPTGTHTIRVEFFQQGGGIGLNLFWQGPGFARTSLTGETKVKPQPKQTVAKKPKQKPDMTAAHLKYIRAMQSGYTAILCSPQFVYLKEKSGQLNSYEIASRLSYFLWSSMPDETLIALARTGKLSDSKVRNEQVERMLKDNKAKAFHRHFPAAWLRLDKLGSMPPSGGDFQFYKNVKVEPMMIKQVTNYFSDALQNNSPIQAFIDSDYTYMNGPLAKWIYRRDDVVGGYLRKVKLNDERRGGIFTLPALMTATANGVDTSPVVRGVWVLNNILGTPPSPPPPGVEPLATDTREANSIREQLELHRKNAACFSCHQKIDPMGFAFENFDVVGRWRDKYKRVKDPIDTSAVMPNGKKVANIVEFKKMLFEQKTLITRCLTEKLLTYASGRLLEPADRGEVDQIVEKLQTKGNGVRDLIKLVVQSDIFLSK